MDREPRARRDKESVSSVMTTEEWDAAPTCKCVYERDPETGDWRLRMAGPTD